MAENSGNTTISGGSELAKLDKSLQNGGCSASENSNDSAQRFINIFPAL